MAIRMRDSGNYSLPPLRKLSFLFPCSYRPMDQYHVTGPPLSQDETVSRIGTLENRFRTQSLGFGGGSSRATTVSLNPLALCEPSQNGLFADCPHRHSPITVRPASPNALPWGSTISKSPSTRIDPLLPTVIFVAAMSTLFFPCILLLSKLAFETSEPALQLPYASHRTSLSIFRHGRIHFVRPRQYPAFEIQNLLKSRFAQEVHGFRGALSAAAVRHDLPR